MTAWRGQCTPWVASALRPPYLFVLVVVFGFGVWESFFLKKDHIHFAANNILANRIKAPEKQRHNNKVEDVSDEKVHDGAGEEDVSVGAPICRLSGRKQGVTNGKYGELNQDNKSKQVVRAQQGVKQDNDGLQCECSSQ